MTTADELLSHWKGIVAEGEKQREEIDRIENTGGEPHYSLWEYWEDANQASADAAEALIYHIEETGQLPTGWGTKP